MTHDNRVVGYVSDEDFRSLSARADAHDMSKSEWVRKAVEEKLDREGLDDAARRFEIEDRLLGIADQIADRAADQLAADLRDDLDTGAESETDNRYDWGQG
jgi:hypothetical protein